MKFKSSKYVVAITLLVALAIPVGLAAQDEHAQKSTQHHHYQFIDLGTFGGPTSVNFGIYPAINNEGTVVGVADMATANPYYPNCSADPFVSHAFVWQGGTLTDLGALAGEANSSGPANITSNGLVSGTSLNGAIDPITGCPEENAVFWKDGLIINLGNAFGGYESSSSSVNSRGQVTGFATNTIPDPFSIFYFFLYGLSNGTQTRAFLWDERNGMQDIGTLGGPDAVSGFINDRGQIAGASFTSDMAFDPFLWEPPTRRHQNGEMIDLGSLGGTSGFEGDGVALNNRGQVVGSSNLAGDVYFHPFLWTKPGPMQDLGTFGGNFGMANAINDAGEVVGWTTNAGDQALLAFFWKNGTMTNLGVLPGKLCSYAHQINSQDQVTGSSDDDCNDGNSHAFLWENGGPMVDLNDLVSGADMTLGGATGINDRGEITGVGVLANGDTHAFLLIPCDGHHPVIEGCDYSMVEAGATPFAAPAPREASGRVPPATLWRRNNRFHFPVFGPKN